MAPRPISLPFRIGTDICSISRTQAIIDKDEGQYMIRWGAKVFSRLEWGDFMIKVEEYQRQVGSAQSSIPTIEDVEKSQKQPGTFAAWLAGRWAVKEAAIKAHHNRKLFMRDISILPSTSAAAKPSVVIDPPRRTVIMNQVVAKSRGLNIVEHTFGHTDGLENTSGIGKGWARWRDPVDLVKEQGKSKLKAAEGKKYTRKLLVDEKERQLVDASISHDTDYAIAVCMAAIGPGELDASPIVDEGYGEPSHEPEWGDKGF